MEGREGMRKGGYVEGREGGYVEGREGGWGITQGLEREGGREVAAF